MRFLVKVLKISVCPNSFANSAWQKSRIICIFAPSWAQWPATQIPVYKTS